MVQSALTCRVSSDHSILEGGLPFGVGLGDAAVYATGVMLPRLEWGRTEL